MAITRVKICGITRPEDAALAAQFGADAIGLNFLHGPRQIDASQAFLITRNLPPMVTVVALAAADPRQFPTAITPIQIIGFYPRLPIFTFQMYGGEMTDFIDRDYHAFHWRVAAVRDKNSLREISAAMLSTHPNGPAAILLDTASEKLGGTGQTFNWNWIAEARDAGELTGLPPLILAGGLTPDNVAEAIRIARPYAVDVSSGVEVQGKAGVKDPIKMRDFIQAAKAAL